MCKVTVSGLKKSNSATLHSSSTRNGAQKIPRIRDPGDIYHIRLLVDISLCSV